MKLYVSSLTDLINEERAQSFLKEIGITKKIDGFSDCLTNCTCVEFKEGLEIRFDTSSRVEKTRHKLARLFINPITNIFKDKELRKLTGFSRIAGMCIQNNNLTTVYVFLDRIIKNGNRLKKVLVHELMHLNKPIGHCDKPYCLFYQSSSETNQIELCEDCKKEFTKLLEKINERK